MNGAFYIGATGLSAQQRALDVVADNIANLNTPAFKRSRVQFAELVAPTRFNADTDAAPVPLVEQLGGVSMTTGQDLSAQGEIKATGRPLDLAVRGHGFLELMGPGGETLLWRGGALSVNADGYLAAANGMPLKAMIAPPDDAAGVVIGQDGKVMASFGANEEAREIGQLELVRPTRPEDIVALGGGLFAVSDPAAVSVSSPGEDGTGVFVQAALESSNVELTEEMITLLVLQRAYAANAQVVQAGDQLMSIANNLKR